MEPRRPKLWMHRTRRFWFGLAVLIGLGACWLMTGYRGGMLYFRLPPSPHRSDEIFIKITQGTFTAIWVTDKKPPRTSYPPSSNWRIDWDWRGGLIFQPDHFYEKSTNPWGGIFRTITLPLWPIPILWLFFWIYWMARMDRKEASHFAQLQ